MKKVCLACMEKWNEFYPNHTCEIGKIQQKLEQETKRREDIEKFLNVSVNLHIEGLEESSGPDGDTSYLKKVTDHITEYKEKCKETNDS